MLRDHAQFGIMVRGMIQSLDLYFQPSADDVEKKKENDDKDDALIDT